MSHIECKRMILSGLGALLWAVCGCSTPPPPANEGPALRGVVRPPSEAMKVDSAQAEAPAAAATLARCGATPTGVKQLVSYWDVALPGKYWLEMAFRHGTWMPAEPLPMPHHHATALQLGNVGEFPALAQQHERRVRFVVDIGSREIEQVAARRSWRTTYVARVLSVCLPAQPLQPAN